MVIYLYWLFISVHVPFTLIKKTLISIYYASDTPWGYMVLKCEENKISAFPTQNLLEKTEVQNNTKQKLNRQLVTVKDAMEGITNYSEH